MGDTDIRALWAAYERRDTRSARDDLILHYAPLVGYVAGRIAGGLPRSVDRADLVSYGVFGLIDAIERFEPTRGVRFETYAIARIKGNILDGLRALDWVPRSVRSRCRAVDAAHARLAAALRRPPTEAELATELGLSDEQLAAVLSQISLANVVALDALLAGADGSDPVTLGDVIGDDSGGPVDSLERAELRRVLADAVATLTERERQVVGLYYFEGLTLAEIGKVLGVTESRVCQIHGKAVVQLRLRIAAAERELV